MRVFYHFTSKSAAQRIRQTGLLLGMTPYVGGTMKHTQWLTTDDDPSQEGLRGIRKIVDRTEARVTVQIPDSHMENVLSFEDFCASFRSKYQRLMLPYFNSFPELTKDWYVYIGTIPKQWIKGVRFYHGESDGPPRRIRRDPKYLGRWGHEEMKIRSKTTQ